MNGRTLVRPARRGMLLLLGWMMLAAWSGGGRAWAQPNFERSYGTAMNESGASVQQTTSGGYIAAGYTEDPVTREQQVYVVRTDQFGMHVWERVVPIGGTMGSYGIDVKQCANGDHVVVGTVTDPTCVQGGCSHIFVFRIDDNGDLIWYRIFGDGGSRQVATGIVETKVALNGATDYIGQFVISGYEDVPGADRYGVLMRLMSNGDMMWAMLYDADPPNPNDNELMSVDEAQVGGTPGDIVAAGFANMPGVDDEIFVVRVDPLTGLMVNGPPLGAGLYGTPARDRGLSIIELRNGSFAGNLVITGESYGRPATTNKEVVMLELQPDPCKPQVADQFLGDRGKELDWGTCVREITDPSIGNIGDVIVTGTTWNLRPANPPAAAAAVAAAAPPPGGTPSLDIFLQQFDAASMKPAGAFHTYGGDRDDYGNGVGVALGIGNVPGFIVTGSSESQPLVPPGNQIELVLIRTNQWMHSCSDLVVDRSYEPANLTWTCNAPNIFDPRWKRLCGLFAFEPGWQHVVCP